MGEYIKAAKHLKEHAKALQELVSEDEIYATKSRSKRIHLAYVRNLIGNLTREMRRVAKQLNK